MTIIKNKFAFINLMVLLMTFSGNCSDTLKTIDSRLAGWKITSKFDPSKAPIQSIKGNSKIIKYWQIGYGGPDSSTYSVIKTVDSLDTYWNGLMSRVKLDKPEVDFSRNILIIIYPGVSNGKFKYRIDIEENDCSINFIVSNYLAADLYGVSISIYPIFGFEVPSPKQSKAIKVNFNIDSRSYGIQPK